MRILGAAVLGAIGVFCGTAAPAAARPVVAEAWAPAFEWIVLDAQTGRVLGEQNADELTYPASLTKMMTLYLTFEQLNQGHITLDQQFQVSDYAASRAPSRLGLSPGELVPVRDLILGVVTKSANDAATVLAEGLAGSEPNFARYMTLKARQLGMDHTWYFNASGLPNPDQRTTGRDIARLALALYQHFPREYRYFATREFEFRGQVVHGHDHLLDWYPGADGIKTGFINASGFNLASSAVRNGHRLIGVVMGGRSARVRDMQMGSLLDQGFAILNSGQSVPSQGTLVASAASAAPPAPQPAHPPYPAPPQTAPPPFPAPAAAGPVPTATQTASASRPSPAVAAAPAATAPAARPAEAEEDAEGDAADPQPSSGIGRVASAALKHLAPVDRAEAATTQPRGGHDGADDWAIQIGAFRAAGAASHAAREIERLAVARGKPEQVVAPEKSERPALYRARLLHFTQKTAHAACAELHRRGIACAIIHGASGGTYRG